MGAASQELTERAKLLISERRYQEAVRACRRALLSEPDQVDVRLLLGEALLALERYDEVRVEMMALARKNPRRAEVHRVLGEAYLRDGRPRQAVESLRRAIELDPGDEIARELLGEAADENAPVSTTIERWFSDEAAPTVETSAPEWVEEKTPVPAPGEPKEKQELAPLVTSPGRPGNMAVTTQARGPRVRSRKPTLAGQPAAFGYDDLTVPLPPPPSGAPAALPRVSVPKPGAAPSAPPPRMEATSVQRPSARRPAAELQTDELELESLSDEQPLDDELPGEPTRAQGEASPKFPSVGLVPDVLSDATTGAQFPAALDVEEPATSVLVGGRSAPNAFGAPPASAGGFAGPPRPQPMAPQPMAPQPMAPQPMAPQPMAPQPVVSPPAPQRSPAPSVRPAPLAPAPLPIAQPAPERPVEPVAPPAAFVAPTPSPAPASRPRVDPGASTARVPPTVKRWIAPAAIGVVAVLGIAIAIGLGIAAWLDARAIEEIRAAARDAGDSGMRTEVEGVVAQIEDEGTDEPELAALKARLLATLTFEHGEDRAALASALVAQLGEPRLTDAVIAGALTDLARGDAASALQRLSGLAAQGEQIAEAFRARAFATAALGRLQEAEEAARQAASLRPAAPRHVALYALMRHRIGDSSGAIEMLQRLPGADASPAVRVARARVLWESGRDRNGALEQASAVIDGLADRATPYQLAWSHLVRAQYAQFQQGDGATALREARAAAEHTPPLDEPFGMQLVATLLAAGAPEEANRELARLPSPAVDAPGRALLTAEVALEVGQLDAAEAALAQATDGPRKSLLRGELLEARGRPDEARPLYEQAMEAPSTDGVRARVRLAAMAMRTGGSERAIALLEPVYPRAVDDLELVPLLVRAYVERDRLGDAQRTVDAALARRQGAGELLAARGAVQLARGQLTEALASLRQAAAARPEDADLQVDLGDAARRAGETDAARQAYEAAIALRADDARASLGLARLALAEGNLEVAQQKLDVAARSGREGLEVARVRGALLVVRGDGAAGLEALSPLAREHDDAEVWTALGQLQAQAEEDSDAARSFARALRRDRGAPEALLGQSLIAVRRGDLGGARRAIETAADQIERRGSTPALQAQVAVARGRLEFENGDFGAAVRRANEAIALDAQNASAHLLLANVAIEQGESPVEHLRRAAAGHAPPPEALGRLASRVGRGEEACRLARRYLEVAPHGYDAPDVRDVADRCD